MADKGKLKSLLIKAEKLIGEQVVIKILHETFIIYSKPLNSKVFWIFLAYMTLVYYGLAGPLHFTLKVIFYLARISARIFVKWPLKLVIWLSYVASSLPCSILWNLLCVAYSMIYIFLQVILWVILSALISLALGYLCHLLDTTLVDIEVNEYTMEVTLHFPFFSYRFL